MIIANVSEMVGRETIALQDDHINIVILKLDLAADRIDKRGLFIMMITEPKIKTERSNIPAISRRPPLEGVRANGSCPVEFFFTFTVSIN